jgi:hypothetical protein
MAPPTVNFKVETNYVLVDDEYYVVGITGSIKAQGQWHSSQTVLAVQDPNQCGRWTIDMPIDANNTFKWKWVVTNHQRTHIYR